MNEEVKWWTNMKVSKRNRNGIKLLKESMNFRTIDQTLEFVLDAFGIIPGSS